MKRTEAPGSLNNLYIDRNLDIGREGTLLIAEDRNALQEEIANAIELSGRTLDAGDDEQLSKSVLLTGGDPQTVDKVVTLGEIPVLPSSNPTQANQATRKGYVDSLDSGNVKVTGNQTIEGDKEFTGTSRLYGDLVCGGKILPRLDSVGGSVSISSFYTPLRGFFNASWVGTNRAGTARVYETSGAYVSLDGGGGPYSGSNQITNSTSLNLTWYYTRF